LIKNEIVEENFKIIDLIILLGIVITSIILLIIYSDLIIYIFKEGYFLIKELIKEFIYYNKLEKIRIEPNEPMQGIEYLDPIYRRYYLKMYFFLYNSIKE